MPFPFPINPATFDGEKFRVRYGLAIDDFFARLNNLGQLELHLKSGITIPDDPPIIESPDPPNIVRRNRAKTTFSDPEMIILRAIVILILNQINTIRAALVPPLPAITIAQFRTALLNLIDAGTAD
jgi:hypothetical protein